MPSYHQTLSTFDVDDEVPPLPPHIRFEQVTKMSKALAGGDQHAARILRNSLKGKVEELIHR